MMEMTIKRLRVRQGLDQRDVEKALGLSGGTVSHWENDRVLPKLKHIQGLARLYNVTTDDLINILLRRDYEN